MPTSSATQTSFPLLLQIALDLFRRPSPSGREDLIRAYVRRHLAAHGFTVSVDPMGNVLAQRGTPASQEGYPLLSFHMDCVCSGSPTRLPAQKLMLLPLDALAIEHGWLHTHGQFVLGGDDKCGGAIALTLAATTSMPLKIIASVEEEIGCLGIEQVDPDFFQDVAYALVLDRRGANHLIVSIADHLLCQGTFAAALMRAAAETGLLVYVAEGALSDALTLSRFIANVANLSVGYYHPHSVHERVSLGDLWRSYQWVQEALTRLPCQVLNNSLRHQERASVLLCSDCQKLALAPTDLPIDLWMFICRCAELAGSREAEQLPHKPVAPSRR